MQRQHRVIDPTAKLEALGRKHAACEEQLEAFRKRIYLSPEEQVEVRRLKREKLRAKDEMRRFSQGDAAAG